MTLRVVSVTAVLGFLALASTHAAAQTPAPSLPAITVVAVTRAHLVDRVIVSGLIEPEERVFVQPQIEGQAIEAIFAEVGDEAQAGETLATLSTSTLELQRGQLEASLASARAGIAQAEAQRVEAEVVRDEAIKSRDRAVSLAARGATTQAAADESTSNAAAASARVTVAVQSLSAAEAQLHVIEAQIANVDLQLRRTEVKAPVAGKVVERNAMVGNIATAVGDPMFVIARDGLLELRADVPQQDILRLKSEQRVEITAIGVTRPLTGKVRLIEPSVSDATRLGRTRISIDDPSQVRTGMFAEAEIILRDADVLSLPVSAVSGENDGASVLRVEDGVVKQVAVTTGIRDGARIEIVSGLQEGDTVVARAGAFVRDGDHVNPVDPDTAALISN